MMGLLDNSPHNSKPARLPALPAVPRGTDPAMYQLLEAIKERLEVREGSRGNQFEKVVTERRLAEFVKGTEFTRLVSMAAAPRTTVIETGSTTTSVPPSLLAEIKKAVASIKGDTPSRAESLIASLRQELLGMIGGSDAPKLVAQEATRRANQVAAETQARVASIAQEAQTRVDQLAIESRERAQGIAANAQSILDNALGIANQAAYTNGAVASAKTELRDEIVAGISAEASERTTLAAQLRGGYSGTDPNQVTSGLFFNERLARTTADNALSQQITLLSAGAGEQFDWSKIWYFDAGIEGWTGISTPTMSGGWLKPVGGPAVTSPGGLALDGAKYTQIRFRVRKNGTLTWNGLIGWNGGTTTATEPTYDSNGVGLVTVNMPWTGTIDHIVVDAYTTQGTSSNFYELDWVAVGRPSPGASSAQLYEEQVARASEDAALASSITSLNAALGTTNANLSSEITTRATADSALASDISVLSATVTANKTNIDAALDNEQTVRANADTAEVGARQTLSAKLTGATDPTGLTLGTLSSGLIFDERETRATETSALSTSISVLTTTVNNNTVAISSEVTARSTEDLALGTRIDAVTATTGSLSAALVTESEARAAKDASLARETKTLFAGEDESAESILRNALSNDRERKTREVTQAAIEQTLRTEIQDGLLAEAEARTTLAGVVNGNQAALVLNYYTKATADSAVAASLTTLQSTMEGPEGSIGQLSATLTNDYYTKVGADGAISAAVQVVEARLDTGDFADVKTTSEATASAVDGLKGQYSVKVNAGGKVAGFGLATTSPVAGPATSSFVIVADKFALANDTSDVVPFAVDTTTNDVYITGNLNVDGSVKIRGTSVTPGTIGDVKAKAEEAHAAIYTADDLSADLASGAATVVSGALNGTTRMQLDPAGNYVVFTHKDAQITGTVGAYTGTVRTALGITAGGLIAGFHRQSDGAWQNSIVIDSATGDVTILGTLKAGSVIETGATVDGVGMGTIKGNAALGPIAVAGLADKLNKAGGDILSGAITFNSAGGFKTSGITIASDGSSSGTGVAVTSAGIVGRNGSGITFAIDTSGNATFKGDITGASGTFAGNLSTNGYVKANGQISSADGVASIVGNESGVAGKGVVGYAGNTTLGSGIYGVSPSVSAFMSAGVTGLGRAGNPAVWGRSFDGSPGVRCDNAFIWNGYTIAAPSNSTTTFLRNDGQWATPSVDWSGITGKPSTFAPSAHGHFLSDIQPNNFDTPSFQFSTDGGVTWTGILLKRL